MKVAVNKIIPFSSVDGTGNRTVIFLQGCNINCKYCHNPETRGICKQCGICVEHCKMGAITFENENILYHPEKCIQCDTCIHVCPNDSSPRTVMMTPLEVYEVVRKQVPFIRGITISGGECMLHADFIYELFRLAKTDGLSTLIDSNGTIFFEPYKELLQVTDGVMLDIKAFDNDDYHNITGSYNDVVLSNAKFLMQNKKLHEVRTVIVPDLFDTERSIIQMGQFLAPFLDIQDVCVKLIAYRPFGVREEYSHFNVPDQTYLQHLAGILKNQGFDNIIMT